MVLKIQGVLDVSEGRVAASSITDTNQLFVFLAIIIRKMDASCGQNSDWRWLSDRQAV